MKSVSQILEQLSSTNSSNDKLDILSANIDNKDLPRFFFYALNPHYVYGLKKIPGYVKRSETVTEAMVFHFLDALRGREVTGNKAIEELKGILENTSDDLECQILKIIKKDPDVGVSSGLIERVWPLLLPIGVKLCKAQPYSPKAISKISFPAISDLKADGARVNAFIYKDRVELFSSGSLKLHGVKILEDDILLCGATEQVLDGECVVLEPDMKTVMPRKKGNGIITKAIKGTISPEEANRIRFHVWDIIEFRSYNESTKYPTAGYRARRESLIHRIVPCSRVEMIESKIVNNITEAIAHFKELLALGQEGTILKNLDFIWDGKRVQDCVKFKLIIENTLKCIDVKISTETKYEGQIGSLICESADKKVVVSVGSGLSDDDRIKYSMESPIGKFFEVRSNGLISDESGWSLYLPRLVEERFDKSEADDFETIEALSNGSQMLLNE